MAADMTDTSTLIALLLGFFVICGTMYADQDPKTPAQAPRTVAILLFDGVELLDVAGPAEVFIVTKEGEAFRVITVSSTKAPVKTMGGMTITPDCAYAECPRADILVLPGGDMRNVGTDGIAWIRAASDSAEVVLSVCMGAFLLARAGLLDGIEVTTHHWGIEKLRSAAPGCTVVNGVRFVDNGKFVTTAGVTAGIDGALHIVSRLLGKEAAQWAAEEWMEYPYKPVDAAD